MLGTQATTTSRFTAVSVMILIGITIAQASEAFLVQGLPSLSPFMQVDFGLSKARLGMVISSVYLGMTASSVAWGWFIDTIA